MIFDSGSAVSLSLSLISRSSDTIEDMVLKGLQKPCQANEPKSHFGLHPFNIYIYILKILFIYFWSKGNGGGKRGRETSMCDRYIHQLPLLYPQWGTWYSTQACALTRNLTSDLSVHGPMLNPLSHTSQGLLNVFWVNYITALPSQHTN